MLVLLPQAVDRAAERSPDAEAVVCGAESLSWGELATRSSRLAGVLGELGVARGDRVAIHAAKGLAATIAMYGIMKAGAAYVPLDTSAPLPRLGMILRDCGIRHVVSEPSRAAALDALATEAHLEAVVGVDGLEAADVEVVPWSEVERAPLPGRPAATIELDLAYVLYTSGSTGVPKGVAHTHRSALAFAEIAAHTYGFRPDDRLTNHAPLHFDLSTMDYFAAALAGATTVVVPEVYTRIPASLSQLLQDQRVTVLYAVPLALTHLLLHGALERRDLSSVRWVLFGGEPFPPRHLRGLMSALPGARFSNVYGPTEVNGVTFWIVPPLPEGSEEPIPIGGAYPNVEPLVVDAEDRPAADGEPGELLVRTPTMMRGYWGRPDLDERAFSVRPGPGGHPQTWLRTGDRVQRRGDGALLFLGRLDRQIKTRGHRVELAEVEAAVTTHPDVEAAAAFAVPDGEGSQRIHVAVTLAGSAAATTPEAVVAHAATVLPRYALPETLSILDALPRTSTGKIDRRELERRARDALEKETP